MFEPNTWKVDWAEEQTTRTDEFQRELQAKSQAMSDLNAEKVIHIVATIHMITAPWTNREYLLKLYCWILCVTYCA